MSVYNHDLLFRQIVENAQDAIIFADRDGMIRLWNSGAQSMFGYSAEEALGQSLDLIIPERLRERHWDGYRKVMSTGITKYDKELLSVPAIRKDGERISLEFSIVPIRDEGNGLLGVAAIIRDVTEHWQREKELKGCLAALESKVKEKA